MKLVGVTGQRGHSVIAKIDLSVDKGYVTDWKSQTTASEIALINNIVFHRIVKQRSVRWRLNIA